MFDFWREVTDCRKKREADSDELTKVFQKSAGRDIVILCIGSDRVIADSLGPLVGTLLRESHIPYEVFGTLEYPVHALNIEKTIQKINSRFLDPFILAVDASIGDKQDVGKIFLEKGPLIPGRAMNKVLPEVGDYQMKGVVAYREEFAPPKYINSTRLFSVKSLAKNISQIILAAVTEMKTQQQILNKMQ
ncbi:spore protease YyaC [Siminovitchia acidinfaciens]|nr:spore protease YyaC [Siminovitchia acidinfaciens]